MGYMRYYRNEKQITGIGRSNCQRHILIAFGILRNSIIKRYRCRPRCDPARLGVDDLNNLARRVDRPLHARRLSAGGGENGVVCADG